LYNLLFEIMKNIFFNAKLFFLFFLTSARSRILVSIIHLMISSIFFLGHEENLVNRQIELRATAQKEFNTTFINNIKIFHLYIIQHILFFLSNIKCLLTLIIPIIFSLNFIIGLYQKIYCWYALCRALTHSS
jgi:hypothetical protein